MGGQGLFLLHLLPRLEPPLVGRKAAVGLKTRIFFFFFIVTVAGAAGEGEAVADGAAYPWEHWGAPRRGAASADAHPSQLESEQPRPGGWGTGARELLLLPWW